VIRLSVLGQTELVDAEGQPLTSVLAQPKRLALLVYLAASPQRSERRFTLLSLFWPELDGARDHPVLNQALQFLRETVGGPTSPAIITHGAEDVAVDRKVLWCDVAAFRAAMDGGRFAEAIALYRGDLLRGFLAERGDSFVDWLDQERSHLRRAAARATRGLAERNERNRPTVPGGP
jgi:DNA-binding SARP family transcriptional activator